MVKILKKRLAKNFQNFTFFYQNLRYRLPLLAGVSIMVGLLDGLGLSMFIPLLQSIADQSGSSESEMGNFSFVVNFMRDCGLELTLTVVLLTMLFFFVLKGFFKWVEQYLSVVYKQFFIKKIRTDNIQDLSKYAYNFFIMQDAGAIQNTMTGETGRVVNAYNLFSKALQHTVLVLTYTFMAFLANAEFATLVAVGGALSNFLFRRLYKYTKKLSLEVTKHNHSFQGLIIQQVANFKYLKATGLIGKYAKKLTEKVKNIEDSNKKIGIIDSAMQGIREPLMMLVVVSVILIQVKVMGAALTTIMLSILFFYRALTAVMQLQTVYNNYLSFTGSLKNLQTFSAQLKRGKENLGKNTFENFNDTIKISDVFYAYQNLTILKKINLTIHKNETLALVGESGSGKTTLLNLIAGLLKPNSGKILIDQEDVNRLDIRTFQKKIGYITQEPVIFSDTIFNNITFWENKSPETLQKFKEALIKANILDFVEQLPQQENTLLGNNGVNLSGGQKQRLSIARELYKNVDFLFMDEATSALDTETEKTIQKNIENLKGKYTIIMIAHRLSTVKNADRVIMMKNGKIENMGTYQELLAKSPTFKRMVELQNVK